MGQTIEDVNDRTLLQQFHSLYKKQDAIETNVENVDAKVEQEKSDRQTADASLRNDLNTITNKIEYNTAQIMALQTGKQDKLTAGTNITIDANNVISASGGVQKFKASDVDSETATSGQVLTANGNGGASWQNASGEKLYEHNIKLYQSATFYEIYLTIICDKSNVLSISELYNLMTAQNKPCSGISTSGPNRIFVAISKGTTNDSFNVSLIRIDTNEILELRNVSFTLSSDEIRQI